MYEGHARESSFWEWDDSRLQVIGAWLESHMRHTNVHVYTCTGAPRTQRWTLGAAAAGEHELSCLDGGGARWCLE